MSPLPPNLRRPPVLPVDPNQIFPVLVRVEEDPFFRPVVEAVDILISIIVELTRGFEIRDPDVCFIDEG